MNNNGINIDNGIFELKFNNPQNFAAYRQSELDNSRIQSFTALQEVPYMSKRFALKRFLGLSQEEITENERLWQEENGAKLQSSANAAGELRSAGITPGAIAVDAGTQTAEAPEDMAAAAEAGAEAAPETPPA